MSRRMSRRPTELATVREHKDTRTQNICSLLFKIEHRLKAKNKKIKRGTFGRLKVMISFETPSLGREEYLLTLSGQGGDTESQQSIF